MDRVVTEDECFHWLRRGWTVFQRGGASLCGPAGVALFQAPVPGRTGVRSPVQFGSMLAHDDSLVYVVVVSAVLFSLAVCKISPNIMTGCDISRKC